MPNDDTTGDLPSVTAPPSNAAAKPAGRRTISQWLLATDTGFSFVRNLTFVSFAGTLIAAYFQYLSAYQDKVAEVAKEDLTAATSAFTEASTAFSVPLSLQKGMVSAFYDAVDQKLDTDDDAYATKNGRSLYAGYDAAYTALRQNIDLLGRKVEIYIDWASDPDHEPNWSNPTGDPVSVDFLGTTKFDCDNDLPFANGASVELKDKSGKPLTDKAGNPLAVDWLSAKHHVFTMAYCFDVTHKLMEPARQWASKSQVDLARKADMMKQKTDFIDRLNKQELRLNNFMSITMNAIDQVRVNYRPTGFICHVPIFREVFNHVGQIECTPVRTLQRPG
jgi:hypothetical protein